LFDFIFHIEFRFTPVENSVGYNSGVYSRNSADGKIWHQAQIGSASGGYLFGDTLVNGQLQRVNLRRTDVASRVKPAGEWNTFEITCLGAKMSLWVNGAVTSEYDTLEVLKGYLGLEAEGFRIEFRNLKLKPKGPYFGGTGGVVEPVVIRQFQTLPHYTEEAIKARVQGSVVLQAIIRSNGSVDEPKIIRSLGHGLDQEAIRCVIKEWRFKPGSLNGLPVDVYTTITITFDLRR
ncbi:MAG TPA: TonB family protein, partial [Acidobacteriota bacterium]|jgi:TonB family protein